MKISQIISELETFAPLPLQEDFDNSGLQVGDVSQELKGILLCLDVTENVIDEAIELDCNLIVSHHPLIFKPLKKIAGRTYIERCVAKACKNDITIYACHTNLDNAADGVNFRLAEKIGLLNVRILSPKKNSLLKVKVYTPADYVEAVRTAMFRAGAGNIGNYDSCSFNFDGEGTFRAGEDATPFVGDTDEFHTEPEIATEMILPAFRKNSVIRAILTTHPYEEPAFDFYPLDNEWNTAGSGVIGELPDDENAESFMQRLKTIFKLNTLKHSPVEAGKIREVAICGGSGAFLIPDAIAAGADIFITGEAKYNDYFDVENRILLAVIGHYESEICTKEIFYDVITKKITNFAVHFSRVDTNPVNYI